MNISVFDSSAVTDVISLIQSGQMKNVSVSDSSQVQDNLGTNQVYTAPVFTTPFNASGDFDSLQTATGETCAIQTGQGYLGKSGRINVNTNNTEVAFRKALSGSHVRIIQFWMRVDASATISTTLYHNLLTTHDDAGWTNTSIGQVQIKGSGAGYILAICDPSNSYVTNNGSTVLSKGTWYKVTMRVTDSTLYVYLNNNNAAEVTQTGKSLSGKYIQSFHLGKYFSQAFSGIIDFDDLYCDVDIGSTPTTTSAKNMDTYRGFMQRFLSYDGAIIRPNGEGSGTTQGSDIVSEGQGYGLMLAVQFNDQTTFNLIETWTENNLLRSNNGSLSTYLNMMGWHYDNVAGSMLDWNYALDGDLDRLTALLWAHHRWGSQGTINYKLKAKNLAADIVSTANTFGSNKYLPGDSTGVGITSFEQNPSYFMLTGMRDALSEFGDTTWSHIIDGSYDTIQQDTATTGALATTKGLYPEWNKFDTSTGLVASDSSLRGSTWNYYSYNAFRTPIRIYWDYLFNAESRAKTSLTGNYLTFLTSEWNTNSSVIHAEYDHSGTVTGNYEKGEMYATYLSAFVANANGMLPNGGIGDSIYNNKILPTYTQHPAGGYWGDSNSGGGTALYFNTSWVTMAVATWNNDWVNWGYSLSASPQVVTTLLINVSDSSTVTENVSVGIAGQLNISVSDSSTVTDVLSNIINIYLINVNEGSTVTDVVTSITKFTPNAQSLSVFDSSTVTDAVSLSITYFLSVFDASAVTEWTPYTTYANESMASSPSTGTLRNSAVWNQGGFVQLTSNQTNLTGEFEYAYTTDANFEATFDFYTSQAAQGSLYFYWGCSATPVSVSSNAGGYVFGFDESSADNTPYTLQFAGSTLSSQGSIDFADGTYHTAHILVIGTRITVWVDGVQKFDYTDSTRSLPGTLFGWGASTGTTSAEHRIRNVSVNSVAKDKVIESFVTNVNDSSTVTDVVSQVLPQLNINVFDASTVTDVITTTVINLLSVTDASTVSDVITTIQALVIYQVSVNDTSTVTDTLSQVTMVIDIVVSETTTVTETLSFTGTIFDSIFDTSTVTENITVVVVYSTAIFDASAVTDNTTVTLVQEPVVFDSSTVTESLTMLVTGYISVFDTSAVTEQLFFNDYDFESVFDATTVTDVPTVNLVQAPVVSDSSTVTESIAITLITTINVFDASTVTDIPSVIIAYFISVFEASSVTDTVGAAYGYSASVFDATSVTESVTTQSIYMISVNEVSVVTDALLSVIIPFLVLIVNESSTVTDVFIQAVDILNIQGTWGLLIF